jgi:hypothetical protein
VSELLFVSSDTLGERRDQTNSKEEPNNRMTTNLRTTLTGSVGAAAYLLVAGWPLHQVSLGRRGRVMFAFPKEAAPALVEYRRALHEVHAHLERAKLARRHDEESATNGARN